MNSVSIIGNLGQDPEVKYTPAGVCVVNFNIAVNEHYKDKEGNKQQKTNWFRVNTFQRLAEIVGQFCKKGSKVGVHGQLQQRTWTDKDGNSRSVIEIRAREVDLLSHKANGDQSDAGNGRAGVSQPPEPTGSYQMPDDDVPF